MLFLDQFFERLSKLSEIYDWYINNKTIYGIDQFNVFVSPISAVFIDITGRYIAPMHDLHAGLSIGLDYKTVKQLISATEGCGNKLLRNNLLNAVKYNTEVSFN